MCVAGPQDGDPLGRLLFDYLVHEGHWDTATRVAQDILLGRVKVSQGVSPVLPLVLASMGQHNISLCLQLVRLPWT